MRSYQGSNVNDILRKPLSEKNKVFRRSSEASQTTADEALWLIGEASLHQGR